MLSDYEQRALEELERRYEAAAPERIAARPTSRPPGLHALSVLGFISVVMVILGAAVAALALATAGAMGWLFWGLWTNRAYGVAAAASVMLGAGHGRPGRRPGESVRRYPVVVVPTGKAEQHRNAGQDRRGTGLTTDPGGTGPARQRRTPWQ